MTATDTAAKRPIINARGPFTPLGVSRSTDSVASAVAEALQDFADIEAMQDAADAALRTCAGAEAGTVVHCAAAGIALSVAAAMAGSDPARIAALPDTAGLRNRVVLPAGHAVNYGHSLEQAVRLAGATPVLVGDAAGCSTTDIADELRHPDTGCLLLVVSRLTRGAPVDLDAAIRAAHDADIPVVIDGAAQIFRAQELIAAGADLLIVSGQKYLASPTAGLVFGRSGLVAAVRAQDKGIGRGMKASKEALAGVIAALEQWAEADMQSWTDRQADKVRGFIERIGPLPGVTASTEVDPAGAPFPRVCLRIDPRRAGRTAAQIADALKSGTPSIWVMDHRGGNGEILLELVPLRSDELDVLTDRLSGVLSRSSRKA